MLSRDIEDIILDNLETDDLSPDMQLISNMLGLETAKQIMKLLGGARLHVPMPSTYKVKALIRLLNKTKDEEHSVIKLARDFRISTDTVSKHIKEVNNDRLF